MSANSYWTSKKDDFKVITSNGKGYDQSNLYVQMPADIIRQISSIITNNLEGVHPEGKSIIIPESVIINMINAFFVISPYESGFTIDSAIEHIITEVKTDYMNQKFNSSISVWNTKYDGELKPYSGIKLNNKRFKSEDTMVSTY